MDTSINHQIAGKLLEAADLLEQQEANPFRVSAYRRAANTISTLKRGVEDIIVNEGLEGLLALPHIGEGIARAVYGMVTAGRWPMLDRLRGALEPEKLFMTVPGIGPKLAERIHDNLSVDTLEALEIASHDGRLEAVPGIGLRRTQAIRAALVKMLNRRIRTRAALLREEAPVDLLLNVDREYRGKAKSHRLPKIAPRRFNPEGKAWLPILHTHRNGWHFTVMFSNTARAHELKRTGDWVVIYFYDGLHRESQRTVVTEARGILMGKRVVRGREEECRDYYLHEAGDREDCFT
jgi:hypothetical protein